MPKQGIAAATSFRESWSITHLNNFDIETLFINRRGDELYVEAWRSPEYSWGLNKNVAQTGANTRPRAFAPPALARAGEREVREVSLGGLPARAPGTTAGSNTRVNGSRYWRLLEGEQSCPKLFKIFVFFFVKKYVGAYKVTGLAVPFDDREILGGDPGILKIVDRLLNIDIKFTE